MVPGRVPSRHPSSAVAALVLLLALAVPGLARAGDGPGTPNIYNGTPTGDFPAVAGLGVLFGDGSTGLCTATLIAPDILLTAAHCVDGITAASAIFFPDGIPPVEYAGDRVIPHGEYRSGVAAFADIALILLTKPVVEVTPMPYATQLPRPRTKAAIVGYGDDGLGNTGAKQVGEVRVKRCPKALRKAGLEKGQLLTSICWKPKRKGSDTCKGDSGGPLIVDGAVLGVTSGGFPDCPGKLSWDTNVPLFSQWIPAAIEALRQADQ